MQSRGTSKPVREERNLELKGFKKRVRKTEDDFEGRSGKRFEGIRLTD